MHEKYIKKGGKKFGPYYYESYRENGVVKTAYIGKPSEKHSSISIIAAIMLSIAALLLIYNNAMLTGHAINLDKNTLQVNEKISGNFELKLREGELIPSGSLISVEFDGIKHDMFLNEFLELREVNLRERAGSYYSSKVEISGSGTGYGWPGKKTVYPTVSFRLEPEVLLIQEGSSEISGSVNYGEDYIYDGLANLIPGSVFVFDKPLSDDAVSLIKEDGKTSVSTSYFEETYGFGQEFLNDNEHAIDLDLGTLDLASDSEGSKTLRISLSYNGNNILSESQSINVISSAISEMPVVDLPEIKIQDSTCNATGGTVTIIGDYKFHTFTTNGTFNVTQGCNAQILVVAGGGGGSISLGGCGGGGGAGGMLTNDSYTLTAQSYNIIVGPGGIGGTSNGVRGTNGGNSSFGGIINATGGGGGGSRSGQDTGADGGSGGGGAFVSAGGSGIAGQGNAGGHSYYDDTATKEYCSAGGGGGANSSGQDGYVAGGGLAGSYPGSGGNGSVWSFNGVTYAGGGGGNPSVGSYNPGTKIGGAGGAGGGGKGSDWNANNATAGINGTGGGGGGGDYYTAANGGSGIVIIRYLAADTTPPLINFTSPTPANGTSTTNTSVQINISISKNNLSEFKLNWNTTNYTFYDNSLLLMMNLDNLSALGENATLAIDNSKYSNNGTAINGAFWNSSGRFGGAYQLDGYDDRIDILNRPSLGFGGKTMSVSVWAYLKSYAPSQGLVIRRTGCSDYGDWVLYGVTSADYNNSVAFAFHNGTGWATWEGCYSNDNLTLNRWTHVTMTYNGSVGKLYFDGNEVHSCPITANIQQQNDDIYIGWDNCGIFDPSNARYFNGSIDEVRIWNRTLNTNEVKQLYQSNLQKYSSTQWYFYSNQSNLSLGTYTYSASVKDSAGNENQTGLRTLSITQAPISITNCSGLQNMNNSLAANYILVNDIDCAGYDSGDGNGFMKIGSNGNGFTGKFDGQNHTISNLYINRPGTNHIGLFGWVTGAEIKNVGLKNVSITGNQFVAGLVGVNSGGNISNSYSTGSVHGNDANTFVGGLVADNGGIISDSYSTASVSGVSYLGGLVGYHESSTITNSYSTGSVSGAGSNIGGLVGANNAATITNSFWDNQTSGQTTSAGGTGKTTVQMKQNATFVSAGWDFTNIWSICETATYPWLQWQNVSCPDITPPLINFTYPTPATGTSTTNTSVQINVSIIESQLGEFKFNWNGTNTTFYDNSLIMMLNLNNNSALGENATYAVDSSRYSFNGTFKNGAKYSPGKFGNAINLDGTDDYISTGFSPTNFTQITLSAWVNLTGTGSGPGYPMILSYGTNSNNSPELRFFSTTGQVEIVRQADNTGIRDSVNLIGTGWHHLVGMSNGTSLTLYKDGNLVGSGFYPNNVSMIASTLNIGARSPGEGVAYYLPGEIDEVAIWNRTLSASEIKHLYKSNLQKFNQTQWYFYSNQSNLSIGTYTYSASAKDTSGNENQTELRTLSITQEVDATPPLINFTSPTPANATSTSNTSVQINVSISESALGEFKFNWNQTNYTIYNDSLILMMNFDNQSSLGENATLVADLSKYSNNGTVKNSALWNYSGKFGGAYQFNGSNYISLGDKDMFSFTDGLGNDRPFSITFWAKMIGPVNKTGTSYLVDKAQGESSTGDNEYHLSFTSSTNTTRVYFGLYRTAVGVNAWENRIVRVTDYLPLEQNRWYHISATYNGSETSSGMKLYIDGVRKDTADDNLGTYTGMNNTMQNLSLGASGNANINYMFNGSIDEMRVYNRTLSADEINQVYQSNLQKFNQSQWYFYSNQSNLSVGTYTYSASAKDASGNENQTELRILNITPVLDTTPPLINFTAPTPANATSTTNTSVSINTSISESNLNEFKFNWNSTNYTLYDNSLIMMLNLNNNSALGENETLVADLSKYGNNGICAGTACPAWNSSGKYGGARNFDGDDRYILANESMFDFDIDDTYSISSWVYWDGTNGTAIYGKNGGSNKYTIYYITARGAPLHSSLSLYLYDGSQDMYAYTDTVPLINGWFHAVTTYDGSNTAAGIKLYFNGIEQSVSTNGGSGLSTILNDGAANIGSVSIGGYYFKGMIDEFAIWNRTLSAAEIKQIYQSNLQKFNQTQWYFYSNQSNLSVGTYTYSASAKDSSGNENQTELRSLTIYSAAPSCGQSDTLGMVSYWRAEGNANDLFGINTGAATGVTYGNGVNASNQAFIFDGNDYVNLGSNIASNFNNNSFTIVMWLYPQNTGNGFFFGNKGPPNEASTAKCLAYNIWGANTLHDAEESVSTINAAIYNATEKQNHWDFIAWTYDDSAKNSTLYINGTLMDSDAYTFQTAYTGNYYLRDNNNEAYAFSGRLDEIALFNRSLSSSEIQALYSRSNSGQPYCIPQAIYSNFQNSLTTDFSSVPDITAVQNATIGIPRYGLINYSGKTLNFGNANLDSNINISYNYIFLNSSALPNQNTSAILTLYNLSFTQPIIRINENGNWIRCDDCKIISYNGNLTFNVSHFSAYSAGENSSLNIFDDTDTITRGTNQQVKFYANYSNATSAIDAANCSIKFNLTGSWQDLDNMTFNSTSKFYEYNKTFLTIGTFYFNVLCNGTSLNYDLLNATDNFTISDTTPPLINFTSSTPANGTSTTNTSVQINVSIAESALGEFKWNWNQTNYTFYNDSLVLMMNMDNNSAIGENSTFVADLSKYGNNGICAGTSCPAWNSSGKFGGAYQFDGASDYINVSDSSILNITKEITISAWVKKQDVRTVGIVSKREWGGAGAGAYQIATGISNEPQMAVWIGGVYKNKLADTAIVPLNNWTYIAGTYDGSNLKIYMNGDLVGTQAQTGAIDTPPSTLFVGGTYSTDYLFNGTIDEVRIWNRSLSATEIRQQYYSNLQKYNSSQWYFYSNQSNLSVGTYTYSASAKDTNGNENQTELKILNIISYPPTCGQSETAGMISYWQAENNANDELGNYDGTVKNATYDAGKIGQAFSMNGSNQYVDFGDIAEMNNASQFTFAYWVNVTNSSISSSPQMLSKWKPGVGGNDYTAIMTTPSGTVYLAINSGGNRYCKSVNSGILPDGIWSHVVWVYNGSSGSMKLYVNNNLITLGDGENCASLKPQTANLSGDPFQMGIRDGGGTEQNLPFAGKIDELAYFNRTLSASEVSTLYSRSISGNPYCISGLDITPPLINFTSPTPANGTSTTNTSVQINVSISESSLEEFKLNWNNTNQTIINIGPPIRINFTDSNLSSLIEIANNTNYTFYDDSLVLMMNLDNSSILGENSTYAVDLSKYRNNGRLVGGGGVWNSSGRYNGGLSFNGNFSIMNTTNIMNYQEWTLEAWAKVAGGLTGPQVQLLGKIGNGGFRTNGEFSITYDSSSDMYFAYYCNAGGHIIARYYITNPFETGWHHVVGLIKGNNFVKIYVDGNNGSTASLAGVNLASLNWTITIGSQNPAWGGNMNGTIDEIRVYNRTLSEAEILQHYYSNLQKYAPDRWALEVNNTFENMSFITRGVESSRFDKINSTSWQFYINKSELNPGIYTYSASAKDSAGNENQTELRTLNITQVPDITPPLINFTSPTPANATNTTSRSVQINVSVSELQLREFKFNWNQTNYTFYNDSLVLMLNFENLSSLGENATLAVDNSKYSNNATINGSTFWNSSGRFGGAYKFGRADSFMTVKDSPNWIFGTNGFSISMWTKWNTINSGGYDTLITQTNKVDTWWEFLYYDVAQKIRFDSSGITGDYIVMPTATWTPSIGTWYYLAVVRDGNNYTFYINGDKIGNDTDSGSLPDVIGDMYIGWDTINAGRQVNGTIDEVRIWNRSLSASEIQQAYYSNLQKFNQTQWYFYSNQSNLSVGTYTYSASAKDSSGNENQTELRTLNITQEVDTTPPLINFTSPTPANGTSTTNTSIQVNVSISESNLNEFKFNWNNTNYTCGIKYLLNNGSYSCTDYNDSSLVLAVNFDNVSSIGENGTFVVDLSKYSNNGTIYSNVSSINATYNSSGKYGNALEMYGSNNVTLANSESLNITGNKITISAWVYFKGDSTDEGGTIQGIVTKTGVNFPDESSFRLERISDTNVRFGIVDSSFVTTTSNKLTRNSWHHIVALYNGSVRRIYIDGNLDASIATSGNIVPKIYPVLIGKLFSNYKGYMFNGTIDEVRIWNRSLSENEIKNLYYSNLYKFNSTQWYFYLNQSNLSVGTYTYSASAKDSSGNENQTELRTLNITQVPDTTPPLINFTYPTPANGTSTTNTSVQINVSIAESSLGEFKLNWNSTNYTFYNDSLVLMMNFDNQSSLGENATYTVDASKYSNNGTVVNGVSWNSSGKYGGAMQFDGNERYIDINGVNLNGDASYTISLWAKPTNLLDPTALLAFGTDEVFYGSIIIRESSGGSIGIAHYGDDYDFTATWLADQWQHVTIAYDKDTSTEMLYVNGAFNDSWNPNDMALNSSSLLRLGELGWPSGGSWYSYNGSIDEVRIWNRSLSASEIQQNYRSNLQKYNSSQWYFYSNQSNLSVGDYTYSASAKDSSGNENQTELRSLTILEGNAPVVSLISPANNTNTRFMNQTFRCNATNEALANMTFYLWNSTNSLINQTTKSVSGIFNQTEFNMTLPRDDSYKWNCMARDTANNIGFASSNFTLNLDTTNPSINFTSPTPENGTGTTNSFIPVLIEANDMNYKNYSYYLYNSTGLVSNNKYPREIGAFSGWNSACFLRNNGNVTCQGIIQGIMGNANYSGGNAIEVATGYSHACALLNNGSITCWGNNAYGKADNYTLGNAIGVTAGISYTCALLNNGNVTCWGANGHGEANNYTLGNAVGVSALNFHTCALLNNGNVTCWGEYPELKAANYTGGNAIQVSAGGQHTCALLNNGNITCWGENNKNQSNNYTQGDAIAVGTGDAHTCALLNNGNVTCWGRNNDNQSNNYTQGDAISLSSGESHNCVLLGNGNVSCWGRSIDGQSANYTNGDAKKQAFYAFQFLNIGTYYLNATACDTFGNCNSTETRSLTILEGNPPVISLISPANNTNTSLSFNTFRCNATNEALANITLYVWNSTGIVNQTTRNATGIFNQTEFNMTLPRDDSYKWNCLAKDSANNMGYAAGNYTLNYNASRLTSCQTLDLAGRKYYLMNDVNTSSGSCFPISASSISIDCQGHFINSTGTTSDGIDTYQQTGLSVNNCTITGFGTNGIRTRSSGTVRISNSTLRSNGRGIIAWQGTNVEFYSSRLESNVYSILIYDAGNIKIFDSVLTGTGTGIATENPASGLEIVNSNITSGISVPIAWPISNIKITNSTISGLAAYGGSSHEVTNSNISSLFFSNTGSVKITNSNITEISLISSSDNTISNSSSLRVNLQSSTNQIARNLTIGNVNLNFVANSVMITNSTAPASTGSLMNLSKYLSITDFGSGAILLNVSYKSSDLPLGINENSLKIYKWNNSDWILANTTSGLNGVDNVSKIVYANITNFSTFAVLGMPLAPTVYLMNPTNNTRTSMANQTFRCNATHTLNLANITFYLWNSTSDIVNQTTSVISGTYNQTEVNFTLEYDDIYKWSCLASDYMGNSKIASNFTLYFDATPPSLNFLMQNPADIDTANVFGRRLNTTYSITDVNGVNASTVSLFYKTNSTSSETFGFVNGTSYSGFSNKTGLNESENWTFFLNDNQIYPATYNYDENTMENSAHSAHLLSGLNNQLKIRLFNVSNSKQYSIFEVMANASIGEDDLRIYYCNNSYASGDPTLSAYCTNFYNLNSSALFNHTHTANSKHHTIPFAINTTDGTIGSVYVTQTSYFLLRTSGNWSIYYLSALSRADTIQSSSDSGSSWNNFAGTIDSHLHQYSGSESLWYYACANDTFNNKNCSVLKQDLLDLAGLPPSAPYIYSIDTQTYKGLLNINWTEAISPNAYPITGYNISLLNSSSAFIQNLVFTNNLSYILNTLALSDKLNYYMIRIDVCDSLNQCSYGLSEIFGIDNTNPVVSLISPANDSLVTSANQTFACNSTNLLLKNMTLFIWDSENNLAVKTTINVSGTFNQTNMSILLPYADTYKWNCMATDSAGTASFAPSNWTLTVNATYIYDCMTLDIPNNIYYLQNNVNCSGFNVTSSNITLNCKNHLINGTGSGSGIMINSNLAKIVNCSITNFDEGISVNSSSNTLQNLTIDSNNYCIRLNGASSNSINLLRCSSTTGVYLSASSGTGSNSNTISDSIINGSYAGVFINSSSSNSLNNLNLFGGYGLFIASGAFTSSSNQIVNSNINSTVGIKLSSATSTSSSSVVINATTEFESSGTATGNSLTMTLNRIKPTTIMASSYSGSINITSANPPAAYPSASFNVSKSLSITNSSSASVDLRIYYSDSDVQTQLTESTLRIYKYDGINWIFANTTSSNNNVDVNNNYAYATINSFSGFAVFGFDTTPPLVSTVSPANNLVTNQLNYNFSCNALENSGVSNITLNVWNTTKSLIITNTTSASGTSFTAGFNQTLPAEQGNFTWNCLAYDIYNNYNYSANSTIVVDLTAPYPVTLISPENNTKSNTNLQTFRCNATDNIQTSYLDLYVWNSSGLYSKISEIKETINYSAGPGTYNIGTGITKDSAGNYIASGYTNVSGNKSLLVVKYDSNFNVQWSQAIISDTYYSEFSSAEVAVDSNDNILALTSANIAGNNDLLAVKLDSSGNVLWNKTFGGSGNDLAGGIAADSQNNVVIVGTWGSGSTILDIWTIKLNSSGNMIWNVTETSSGGGGNDDKGLGVAIDSQDNIITVGDWRGPGWGDTWTIKYNSSGSKLWEHMEDFIGATDRLFGAAVDLNNNIYVTGWFAYGGQRIGIIKYNPSGNVVWWRADAGGIGYNLVVSPDGNEITIVGTSLESYDSSGNLLWQRGTNGNDVVLNQYNNPIIIGSSGDNIALSEYAQIFNPAASLSGEWNKSIADGNYNWNCRAYDTAGNSRFADSNYTLLIDSKAPNITIVNPGNGAVLQKDTTEVYVNITTDETAECRYSTINDFSFNNGFSFETTNSTEHSFNLKVAAGESYTFYYKCNDSIVGNINQNSTKHSFSVMQKGGPACEDTCSSNFCTGYLTYGECSDHDDNGCKDLLFKTCPSRSYCSGGGCVSCSDQCTAGAKECEGNSTKECIDTNGDGCYEWSSLTACQTNWTCFGGTCSCTENWTCTNWTKCTNSLRTRTCKDENGCGTSISKPDEVDTTCIPEHCIDGTLYDACSINKPKYCLNGDLIDRCDLCNCSSGKCLNDKTCGFECTNDNDCAKGYECKDNKCWLEQKECDVDADCPIGKYCSNGACKTLQITKEESPALPISEEAKCIPKWKCSELSECKLEYSITSLLDLEPGKLIEGKSERTCYDENQCMPSRIESIACSKELQIKAEREIYCDEPYINIYNLNGTLIASIKEREANAFDISLGTEYGLSRPPCIRKEISGELLAPIPTAFTDFSKTSMLIALLLLLLLTAGEIAILVRRPEEEIQLSPVPPSLPDFPEIKAKGHPEKITFRKVKISSRVRNILGMATELSKIRRAEQSAENAKEDAMRKIRKLEIVHLDKEKERIKEELEKIKLKERHVSKKSEELEKLESELSNAKKRIGLISEEIKELPVENPEPEKEEIRKELGKMHFKPRIPAFKPSKLEKELAETRKMIEETSRIKFIEKLHASRLNDRIEEEKQSIKKELGKLHSVAKEIEVIKSSKLEKELLDAKRKIQELSSAREIGSNLREEIEREREKIRKEIEKVHSIEKEAKIAEPVKLEKELLDARRKIEELQHMNTGESFKERINRLNSMKERIKEGIQEMEKEIRTELSKSESYSLEKKIENAKKRIKEIEKLIGSL